MQNEVMILCLPPIPQLDFLDSEKSMIVHLNFSSRTAVTLEDTQVSYGRARTHIGDPPFTSWRYS